MTKEIVNEQPVETQQVQTVAQKKSERNHAIEFWRFFFAIAILGYHIGTILAPRTMAGIIEAATWMAGAGEILFVFTLTAGYFLVKHFKRLQANPEYASRTASGRAWEYLWGRIKALLPVLALGIILGVIAVAIFQESTFAVAINSVFNGLWEFLGLYAAGYPAAYSQANGAMWFISGLLICSYIIYWAMCKNEDVFAGFIAPFLFVFLGGWWCFTDTRASQTAWSTFGAQTASTNGTGGSATNATAIFGMNNGLIFVLMGMLAGIMLYYFIQKIKDHKFTSTGKFVLSLLYLVAGGLLLWYTIYPPTWFNLERWTVALLCIIVIGLTLLNKDSITNALNNKYTNGILSYLGSISLHIYMLHYPVAIFILKMFGPNTAATTYSFWSIYIPAVLITIVLSILLKELMDIFHEDREAAKLEAAKKAKKDVKQS